MPAFIYSHRKGENRKGDIRFLICLQNCGPNVFDLLRDLSIPRDQESFDLVSGILLLSQYTTMFGGQTSSEIRNKHFLIFHVTSCWSGDQRRYGLY